LRSAQRRAEASLRIDKTEKIMNAMQSDKQTIPSIGSEPKKAKTKR
jgi:hypothetical protein